MVMLLQIAVATVPLAVILALLLVANRFERRRLATIAHQIRLTDAIHARVGAAVAPVVRKPFARGWQVLVAAPLDRREILDTMLDLVRTEFEVGDGPYRVPFEIVLSPQFPPARRSGPARTAVARSTESMSWV
jgi:hypothetical protein